MTKREKTVDILAVALKFAQEEGDSFVAYLIGMALQEAATQLQRSTGTKNQAV